MSHEHNRNKTWRTADGRSIPIKDMTLGHLVNVLNWIIDNSGAYPKNVLDLMTAEAQYRQLVLFADGKDFPQKMGRRWKIVDPNSGQGRIEPPPADYIEASKNNPEYVAMFERTQKKRKQEKEQS